MKQILVIALLIVTAAGAALAQSESKSSSSKLTVESQLIDLERQLSDALVRQDAALLDHLWSKDLVCTFPDGKMSNKAQRLALQKPNAQPSPPQSVTTNDEIKVFPYGNTAVVTVLSTWKGTSNNQPFSSQFQATHVWAKQQGRWQLVAAHVSPVKK